MCLAMPGKIIRVDDKTARVDFDGVERDVHIELLPGAGAGDYILAHAGFAIQIIDRREAEETLRLLRELMDESGEAFGEPEP